MIGKHVAVAYAPDLMDASKLRNAGAVVVRSLDELRAANANLVLVDLSRPGVLEIVPQITGRVIGFGPHVETDLLAAARTAGCDEVLPRSVFFNRLAELIETASST